MATTIRKSVMNAATSFFSSCPRCGRARLHAYERTELLDLVGADREIDAYCLKCDVVWHISPQERSLVVRHLATVMRHVQRQRTVRPAVRSSGAASVARRSDSP